jgi:hypothetical protein
VGKGAVEKVNDDSDGNQKKAKEKKGGGISARVSKAPQRKRRGRGRAVWMNSAHRGIRGRGRGGDQYENKDINV